LTGGMKYIDLTMTYRSGMRGVDIEPAKTLQKDGWNASNLQIYSHAGTHMDAPVHFEVNEKTIDHYPISRFFCDCWVVDILECKPSQLIGLADMGDIVNQVSPGEGLLFRTGWSAFAAEEKYRNELPRISQGLARWCAEKGIALIGVEPPSVADGNNQNELIQVHTILLKADILIIEGLCNLDQISQPKVKLIALPLKISDGDGAPCRVIAIENIAK